jgi:Beta/Gamma crystallin
MKALHLVLPVSLVIAGGAGVAHAQTKPLPPSTAGWYVVLFEQPTYRGSPVNHKRAVSNLRGKRVRSITIGEGRWQLCEGINYTGRCTVLETSSPDLPAVGLSRVSSLRPQPGGPPAPPPTGGGGAYIVLFDQPNFRGSPRNVDAALSNTGLDARVGSITIGRGIWEICEGTGYSGRCVALEKSVADLSTVGFRGRVRSVRPVDRQPR